MFTVQNGNKLMPYGWKEGLSKDEILNGYNYTSKNAFGETKTYFISCKPDNEGDEYSRHACIDLLMLNNWEMDKDYPW